MIGASSDDRSPRMEGEDGRSEGRRMVERPRGRAHSVMSAPLPLESVATLQPLARWLPHLRDVPRLPLTTLPTPVEPLERLGRIAGIAPPSINRDDPTALLSA